MDLHLSMELSIVLRDPGFRSTRLCLSGFVAPFVEINIRGYWGAMDLATTTSPQVAIILAVNLKRDTDSSTLLDPVSRLLFFISLFSFNSCQYC